MAKSKNWRTSTQLLAEAGCMFFAVAGIWGLSFGGITKQSIDYLLSYIVFVVLGIAVIGFGMRKGLLMQTLDYDNGEHPWRFWFSFLLGMIFAFVCLFLPVGAWPFLPIYILLSLYSNLALGTLGATVLLIIPVCLSGAGMEIFLLYLISGCFGVILFKDLKSGFKMAVPFLLSMAGLLVCDTAGTVLVADMRPETESFIFPVVNVIVSGIMVLGIIRLFLDKVVYKYRENYLDLNDPENEILGALKQLDKKKYMKSIHTAYFCQRIAAALGLNEDALKCAGYYHSLAEGFAEGKENLNFPPETLVILEEYQSKGKSVFHKETAVLMASESIVATILMLFEKADGNRVDYDKVIDAVFKRYQDTNVFKNCDISMKEFFTMKKIFKEEKLYYDFLR